MYPPLASRLGSYSLTYSSTISYVPARVSTYSLFLNAMESSPLAPDSIPVRLQVARRSKSTTREAKTCPQHNGPCCSQRRLQKYANSILWIWLMIASEKFLERPFLTVVLGQNYQVFNPGYNKLLAALTDQEQIGEFVFQHLELRRTGAMSNRPKLRSEAQLESALIEDHRALLCELGAVLHRLKGSKGGNVWLDSQHEIWYRHWDGDMRKALVDLVVRLTTIKHTSDAKQPSDDDASHEGQQTPVHDIYTFPVEVKRAQRLTQAMFDSLDDLSGHQPSQATVVQGEEAFRLLGVRQTSDRTDLEYSTSSVTDGDDNFAYIAVGTEEISVTQANALSLVLESPSYEWTMEGSGCHSLTTQGGRWVSAINSDFNGEPVIFLSRSFGTSDGHQLPQYYNLQNATPSVGKDVDDIDDDLQDALKKMWFDEPDEPQEHTHAAAPGASGKPSHLAAPPSTYPQSLLALLAGHIYTALASNEPDPPASSTWPNPTEPAEPTPAYLRRKTRASYPSQPPHSPTPVPRGDRLANVSEDSS